MPVCFIFELMLEAGMKNNKRSKRINKHLEHVNLFAAGIDIGSQSHYVSVPEDLSPPLRK